MTTVAPISDAQYLTFLREECERDFEFFARYFFRVRKGSKFVMSEHHLVIIADLMAIWRGDVQNQITNIPPRYSKTELCVVLFVAWCFVRNPRCEFIHLSYAETLAQDNSVAIREVIKSAEFRQLWPHITIVSHKSGKEAWATPQGGSFLARAHGGQVTGFGAGRLDEVGPDGTFTFSGMILIDDPLKPDDARHDPLRKGANRRWTETIKSRRNSPRTPVHCIMQRIHEDDFTAALLRDQELISTRFRHLIMAALIDEGLPTERALWPAKHTVAQLKAMRDNKNDRGQMDPVAGETFSGQYQQRPTPPGGNLFAPTWWRFYADRAQVMRLCTSFIITCDTAMTEDRRNDPCVLQLWGFQGVKRMYLIDQMRDWWEMPALVSNTMDFVRKWPMAKRFYVEAKNNGLSLVQTVRTPLRLLGVKAIPWVPEHYDWPTDKVGRAQRLAVQVHGGVVWIPETDESEASYQPWAQPFVDEHTAFTKDDTHAHDDQKDGADMAASVWVKAGGGVKPPALQSPQQETATS